MQLRQRVNMLAQEELVNSIKVHGPRCMLASAAMLFGTTIEDVQTFLGHDGLEVIGDEYKGIHIQEIQRYALSKGYALACFEPMPVLEGRIVECWKDDFPLNKFEGLLLCDTTKDGKHCVAWDGNEILNPTDAEVVGFHQFWAKIKMPHLS